ncbi:MAG TPA: DUF1579 family protein [Pyrinomonadaceae bacterium]|nr:DUF1579 family protein [Pyrinomonadaceae bacterium]
MSVNNSLASLAGNWSGINKLYMSWTPETLSESTSTAAVGLKVNGQFVEIGYTWEFEGKPQEGVIVIGCDTKSNAVQAVWRDSWHMSHKFMLCDGAISDDGLVNITGSYQVPDNPDWGWRTEIVPGNDNFRYRMFNVSPEGVEELAVDTEFSRVEKN